MHAQVTMILQHIEALPAGAAGIEMNDKLVNHSLQRGQVPAPATHSFQFLSRQTIPAQVIPVWRSQLAHLGLRGLPVRFVQGTEPTLDTIGIISARVHPEHDAGTGANRPATTISSPVRGTITPVFGAVLHPAKAARASTKVANAAEERRRGTKDTREGLLRFDRFGVDFQLNLVAHH